MRFALSWAIKTENLMSGYGFESNAYVLENNCGRFVQRCVKINLRSNGIRQTQYMNVKRATMMETTYAHSMTCQ